MKPKTSIKATKIGAGQFKISVMRDWEDIGSFIENTHIDDIQEMIQEGFESNLSHFETFEEVENYCITKAKKS
jgi:hypothetical protein